MDHHIIEYTDDLFVSDTNDGMVVIGASHITTVFDVAETEFLVHALQKILDRIKGESS
jgi:hypothetical protein